MAESSASSILYNISSPQVSDAVMNESITIAHHVEYTDPEILAVLGMGSFGFILNIAVISIASRRPAFFQVPVKSLVISLGSANLFIIVVCMLLNAAWYSLRSVFGQDCRFFKTLEAFSLNAAAYVVVAWVIDRCRSCMVYSAEKLPPEPSVRKPRHLTKLIIATWVLALLMSLQHVIVVPFDVELDVNETLLNELKPAKMACVSRGIFYPPWKQMIVEFTSICTTYLIPVAFIVGCLAALLVNQIRKTRKSGDGSRAPLRRFYSYDDEASADSRFITAFTICLAVLFITIWGPYYFALIAKISGSVDVDVSLSTIFYLAGLAYPLASPVLYLNFHLFRSANCCRDPSQLGRSSSTIRERIEMLQRNQLSRRFDDL
ncbi:hypothetical protein RvY_07461 [Ramazzottius varieornatus]|uniref:G-protein coupled receptors family 1 profile domain-containing protein n=1 Tax=Ramazzottius varieornatus TaxID=947166 RepID=A0A1D1V296_RAMVA|nr:hypothetical protein RvY_07461 [Ramazzottius varieornatus]